MGHHLFIHDDKSLPMGDWDVALVRYFLIEGARRHEDGAIASVIEEWEYQGPVFGAALTRQACRLQASVRCRR